MQYVLGPNSTLFVQSTKVRIWGGGGGSGSGDLYVMSQPVFPAQSSHPEQFVQFIQSSPVVASYKQQGSLKTFLP